MARNANAPRRQGVFPPMRNGKFREPYLAYQRDVELCYALVRLGSGLVGRELELIMGGPRTGGIVHAMTNGTQIYIPKMHPNPPLVTKHELAHIVFESDLQLRRAYVLRLISDLAKEEGLDLKGYQQRKLVHDAEFFINILDDLRVNSLWGFVYPGDGMKLESWYFGTIAPAMKQQAPSDVDNFFTFAKLAVLRQEPESTKWGHFREAVETAAEDVLLKNFEAMLLVAGTLIRDVTRALMLDAEAADSWLPNSTSALGQLAAGSVPGKAFKNDNAGFDVDPEIPDDYRPPPSRDVTPVVDKLATTDPKDIQRALQEGEDAAIERAMELRKEAHGKERTVSEDERLTRGAKANVKLVHVPRSQVVPAMLTRKDLLTAQRWQEHFARVIGLQTTQYVERGARLDARLYMRQRLSGQRICCYRHETRGRGFRVVLLVDMSGSMADVFPAVERLAVMLQRSLDFPFVHIDVMGFNCTEYGEVTIFTYPERITGLVSPVSQVEGVTPLSHAIHVAGRKLAGTDDDCHLFVLSDGYPLYFLANQREVDLEILVKWTAAEVRALLSYEVRTWCFMIGNWTAGASEMNQMFGESYWRPVPENDVYAASFDFIQKQFMNFVRTM